MSRLLYASIGIQFIAAILIIPLTGELIAFSVGVFAAGILFFRWMANRGVRRLAWLSQEGHTHTHSHTP